MSPRSDVDRGIVQVDPEARCEQKYHVTGCTNPHGGRDVILLQPVRFSVGLLRGLGPYARAGTAQRLAASRSLLGTRSSFLGLG